MRGATEDECAATTLGSLYRIPYADEKHDAARASDYGPAPCGS